MKGLMGILTNEEGMVTYKSIMKNNRQVNRSNSQRKNKKWLRSRDQRKHMKVFNVAMVQRPDGSFHIVGGGAEVAIRKNQHAIEWYPVDVRDLACEIRMNGIRSN